MDIPSYSLSHLLKLRDDPGLPTPNKLFSSQADNFQKLLADASFTTAPLDEAEEKGNVMPRLVGGVSSPQPIHRTHPTPRRSWAEQFRIYKEDQLLAHPGGDYFNLKAEDPRIETKIHTTFWEKVGKGIKDALDNAGNFVKDLLSGSRYRYVGGNGQFQSAQRKGLLSNVLSFCRNVVSGLSFGQVRTDSDPKPQGIVERVRFVHEKLIKKALLDDFVFGIPSSAVNLLDDTALAVWNLMEVVPDVTIANIIPEGQRLVTSLFDNGQVLIDYITDCVPTSDAWMRVHAYQVGDGKLIPPVFFNLKLPERYAQDSRWSTVRNTPFRKTIETIGSLLADAGIATVTHYAIRTSTRND